MPTKKVRDYPCAECHKGALPPSVYCCNCSGLLHRECEYVHRRTCGAVAPKKRKVAR